MAFTVPPSVNYPNPLIAVPAKSQDEPKEGRKIIVCPITWGTMGGASKSVFINLQNNATLEYSQVSAISVDNSACGSDVQFVFPDTEETMTIPAYSPKTIIQVFTNQTQFYVVCPKSLSSDITRFSILNYVPPPIATPVTQLQNAANVAGISTTTSGTQQVIPAGVNGTIEGAVMTSTPNAAAAQTAYYTYQLVDGASNVIAQANDWCSPGTNRAAIVFQNTNMNVRFSNGLSVVWTVVGTGGTQSSLAANIYYRTP